MMAAMPWKPGPNPPHGVHDPGRVGHCLAQRPDEVDQAASTESAARQTARCSGAHSMTKARSPTAGSQQGTSNPGLASPRAPRTRKSTPPCRLANRMTGTLPRTLPLRSASRAEHHSTWSCTPLHHPSDGLLWPRCATRHTHRGTPRGCRWCPTVAGVPLGCASSPPSNKGPPTSLPQQLLRHVEQGLDPRWCRHRALHPSLRRACAQCPASLPRWALHIVYKR